MERPYLAKTFIGKIENLYMNFYNYVFRRKIIVIKGNYFFYVKKEIYEEMLNEFDATMVAIELLDYKKFIDFRFGFYDFHTVSTEGEHLHIYLNVNISTMNLESVELFNFDSSELFEKMEFNPTYKSKNFARVFNYYRSIM